MGHKQGRYPSDDDISKEKKRFMSVGAGTVIVSGSEQMEETAKKMKQMYDELKKNERRD